MIKNVVLTMLPCKFKKSNSRYLKGSIPTIETTLEIAKYVECSLDYLFGLSYDKGN